MNELPFLGFDLSTPATLVALVTDAGRLISRRSAAGDHARGLFSAVEEVLAEAGLAMRDVAAVGVGRGPGSFTGVRSAVMAGKALAWANRIPLYAPTTLEVLARGAQGEGVVVPLVDARRGEVYCDVYLRERDRLMPTGSPVTASPGDLPTLVEERSEGRGGEVLMVGTGAAAYRDALGPLGLIGEDPYPRPEALWEACRLASLAGLSSDPLTLEPMYLREPDAAVRRPGGQA